MLVTVKNYIPVPRRSNKSIISKFDPNNPETYPPNARWILFADKYDRKYISL